MFGQFNLYQDIPDDTTVNLDLEQYSRFGFRGGKATLYAAAELINQLRVTMKFGSTDAVSRGYVPLAVAQGRVLIPDDFFSEGHGGPGDPLQIIVENIGTAAAACEIYAKLIIQ